MKHNRFVLAGGPVLIFVSPRKSAIPRRLRITLWQTHSWIRNIIKLRKRSESGEKTQTMRGRMTHQFSGSASSSVILSAIVSKFMHRQDCVSEGRSSGLSGPANLFMCPSAMITKRPKLVTEMSCQSGTWVHLRCILNAANAPFLKGVQPIGPQQEPPRTAAPAIFPTRPRARKPKAINSAAVCRERDFEGAIR